MLILYLVILITTLYFVSKLLVPEMRKPSLSTTASITPQADDASARIEKLEMMLDEKNKNIQHMLTDLRILHVQAHDFDEIRGLLEEEIKRLREQNRIFRSELGLPAGQPKENSIT